MDTLRPGHAHRSSSDRLLNNYLESQKGLTTALLTLLSHSHSSTSSLLAYVTSSPGVLLSVRRAVRHAAFEGPLSPSMIENPVGANGSSNDTGTPGWASYVSGLEDFRQDLKQIHLLEEEMTRVKRDKEILVTRLIKQTKARPTKSDIKDMASNLTREYDVMSSTASSYSVSSDVSANGNKDTRRAHKLKEAQAELLGCEEHLRGLEVRIESERNKVMYRGLEERFRAMEVVAQMWLAQARRGLEDLEKLPELPMNAYELDSNGSLAPSQSASQVGYDDPALSPKRALAARHAGMQNMHGHGSISGSIAEEEEGSSDEEQQGNLVVHENRPRNLTDNHKPAHSSPLAGPPDRRQTLPANPGRRAASEMGAPSYNAPRSPLRRTMSNEQTYASRRRAGSDTSSNRTATKKKKGFFASIARFFKGPPKHGKSHGGSGGGSGGGGGWSTRTDTNLRHSQSSRRRVRSDSSSSDEDMGNLVAVANNSTPGWNVADVGRVTPSRSGVKRAASAKSRSTVLSTSTVTGRKPAAGGLAALAGPGSATEKARPHSSLERARPQSATEKNRPASALEKSRPMSAEPDKKRPLSTGPQSAAGVSRSGTVKSTKSATTVRSTSTAKLATKPKTRANGSIARSASVGGRPTSEGPNIMSIVDMPPPAMPDVPRAPDPQMGQGMTLAKAPGSSIIPQGKNAPAMVLPSHIMSGALPKHSRDDDELKPSDSISRSNSRKSLKSQKRQSTASAPTAPGPPAEPRRAVSPLPPSKQRAPPLKSAMRPTSPTPGFRKELPPPVSTLFSVTAPGPVQLPPDPEPEPIRPLSSASGKKTPGGDDASIYESATEGAEGGQNQDSDSEDDQSDLGQYNVVENERIARRNEIAAVASGHELPERFPQHDDEGSDHTAKIQPALPPVPQAPGPLTGDSTKIGRRKSVRIANNGDEEETYPRLEDDHSMAHLREQERQHAKQYMEAAAAPDDSPPPSRMSDNWDTRIGRMRDDTSEDEDEDPTYVRARKNLITVGRPEDGEKIPKSKKKNRLSMGSTRSKTSSGSRR